MSLQKGAFELKMKKLIWLPRIILFLQILFFGMFSFDTDIHKLLILFIPVYILTAILLISWKSPRIASFLTFIVMIVFAVFFSTLNYYMKFLVITLPQFIAFILFTLTAIFTIKDKNEGEDEQNYDEENEDSFSYDDDDDEYYYG